MTTSPSRSISKCCWLACACTCVTRCAPRTRYSVPPLQVGAGVVIDQKYRLTMVLGQGGFGTVYRALHVQLDKEVAVKVLHPDYLHSPEVVRRFKQEGVSACRVRHPNAVVVMDAGTTGSGVPYLVMELLEGNSLADELDDKGAMRLQRCVELIDPVCNALREAHNSGIVHRDIKPANIMLSRSPTGEEVVKVLDFGIAKFMESQPASANTSNQAPGTPRYMAPERLLGEPSDAKADVYSVGVTVFEMLSGTLPFPKVEGNPLQQAVKQLQSVPTVLLTLRPDLAARPGAGGDGHLGPRSQRSSRSGHLQATLARLVHPLDRAGVACPSFGSLRGRANASARSRVSGNWRPSAARVRRD